LLRSQAKKEVYTLERSESKFEKPAEEIAQGAVTEFNKLMHDGKF
jgi:hypothetical protein